MKNYLKKVDNILLTEPDPAYARRARIIFEHVSAKSDSRILEIGCGRGFYVNNLAKLLPKSTIWGIDLNETYLAVAKNNAPKNCKLSIGDAEHLPFKNNYFDTVIISEVLEHVTNDLAVLKEIRRTIKNNGRLLISVPNHDYPFLWDPVNWILEKILHKHLPASIWWLSGIWADHQRLYYSQEIENIIKNAGFEVVKEYRTTHFCLPFSHFIFYGIGKNIVEKNTHSNFNRFNINKKNNWLVNLVLFPIRLVDRLNEKPNSGSSVNLVIMVRKSEDRFVD